METLESDNRPVLYPDDDTKHVRRVRTWAIAGLILIVLLFAANVVFFGPEFPELLAMYIVMAGLGIFGTIRVILRPGLVERPRQEYSLKTIISRRGDHLLAGMEDSTLGEKRLVIQDALDSIRLARRAWKGRVGVKVVAGLGALALLIAAVAAVVTGQDLGLALLCLVGMAFFGGMGFLAVLLDGKFNTAESILEEKLRMLNNPALLDPTVGDLSPSISSSPRLTLLLLNRVTVSRCGASYL